MPSTESIGVCQTFSTLNCDFTCSGKKKNLQINPQDLLRCSSVINTTRLICKYLQRKPRANTTTPEMERSYINSTRWPTFSAAECGQKSLKAAVVSGPFCLTSGEIFIIPHRQHGDARSPLIYSDPSRRQRSGVSIREDKEEKMLQITDLTRVIHSSFSLLVQFPAKSPAG